jgi:hypothetical protein
MEYWRGKSGVIVTDRRVRRLNRELFEFRGEVV